MAGCVAKVVTHYAGENAIVTRTQGAADEKVPLMLEAWDSVCKEFGLVERNPCVLRTLEPKSIAVEQARKAQGLQDCMPFLEELLQRGPQELPADKHKESKAFLDALPKLLRSLGLDVETEQGSTRRCCTRGRTAGRQPS